MDEFLTLGKSSKLQRGRAEEGLPLALKYGALQPQAPQSFLQMQRITTKLQKHRCPDYHRLTKEFLEAKSR